jgi:hypothetical protein
MMGACSKETGMDYQRRRKEFAMDEKHHQGESSEPRKKSTKEPGTESKKGTPRTKEPLGVDLDQLRAAFDSCMIRYKLALQEADLTMAFCRDHRHIEGLSASVQRFKGYIEKMSRSLEEAREPWATDGLTISKRIHEMDEETISEMPHEIADVVRSFRQGTDQFNENIRHGFRVVERNNSMLENLTKVFWSFRWEEEKEVRYLIESLKNIGTEPARGEDSVSLTEILMRKPRK